MRANVTSLLTRYPEGQRVTIHRRLSARSGDAGLNACQIHSAIVIVYFDYLFEFLYFASHLLLSLEIFLVLQLDSLDKTHE